MPISSAKAAELGRKHRLTLADVGVLQRMADDDADAEKLAADFSDNLDYEDLSAKIYRGEPT